MRNSKQTNQKQPHTTNKEVAHYQKREPHTKKEADFFVESNKIYTKRTARGQKTLVATYDRAARGWNVVKKRFWEEVPSSVKDEAASLTA